MSFRNIRLVVFSLFAGVVFMVGCNIGDRGDFGHMVVLMESELDETYQERKRYQNENIRVTANRDDEKNGAIPDYYLESGFWAGNLWLMYELTGNDKWKERALQFTLPPEGEQWNEESSLLGARMMASFGRAIKLNDDKTHRNVLVQSAKVLSSQFNPGIGAIGELMMDSDSAYFSVNIVNMLNIDLLFWAAKETGNENFRKIAVSHVQTILNNHFGDDQLCSEIVDYDLKTGSILRTYNRNGRFNKNSWNLGQAVALHGVTAAYRETNRGEFLQHAERIADFILSQPPIAFDMLPSYNAAMSENPGLDCDFSTGVITASALYELSRYSANDAEYIRTADNILEMIFFKRFGEESNKAFLFSTSSKSKGNTIDKTYPGLLTDFYFLESLVNRRASIQ